MRRECRERFPRHRLQRKSLVNDPCVTHVPWCMSGSLTRDGWKTFPAFPAHAQPEILRIWQEAHVRWICPGLPSSRIGKSSTTWAQYWAIMSNVYTSKSACQKRWLRMLRNLLHLKTSRIALLYTVGHGWGISCVCWIQIRYFCVTGIFDNVKFFCMLMQGGFLVMQNSTLWLTLALSNPETGKITLTTFWPQMPLCRAARSPHRPQ